MGKGSFTKKATIGETIIEYRLWKNDASCEEILAYIKKHWPGGSTTIGSVASTLSKACKRLKNDVLFPGRMMSSSKGDDEVPIEKFDMNAAVDNPKETNEEAFERIKLRYEAMMRLSPKVFTNRQTSLIVSGPPGLQKSWNLKADAVASGRLRHNGMDDVGGGGPSTIEGVQTCGYYDWISGGCSEVGLYRALWNMRKGGVLVFDDCDGVFRDEDSCNLLKIATDTTAERLVSWRKNATWLDDYGIDRTFDFKGSIAFLTNIDFERTIANNPESKMTDHYKALIDRSAYLCLTVRSARDFMMVLRWKAGNKPHSKKADPWHHNDNKTDGFLRGKPWNFEDKQLNELFTFIGAHQRDFYNLSLRLVSQMASQMIDDPEYWQQDAMATKMKTLVAAA